MEVKAAFSWLQSSAAKANARLHVQKETSATGGLQDKASKEGPEDGDNVEGAHHNQDSSVEPGRPPRYSTVKLQ